MDQHHSTAELTTAADVMTTAVVTVAPETSLQDVARLLLKSRVSAVPVVDGGGGLVGIVSEGDLLGRSTEDRLAGQEWWLAILSRPGHLEAELRAAMTVRQARDVMQRPLVTAEADMPIPAVAELLRTHAIKRVPVMRDGRMVGIVSRADLLQALEGVPRAAGIGAGAAAGGNPGSGGLASFLGSFFNGIGSGSTTHTPPLPASNETPAALTATSFRHLVEESVQSGVDEKQAAAHAADLSRIAQVKSMLHDHLGSETWDRLMAHARVIAAHGGKEIELLRFPSELCSDGGRKIGIVDPAWAETLQGEAAELYVRWLHELKPAGFGLAARVVDYPHGMPGNIALFLVWES